MSFETVCLPCKSSHHDECSAGFALTLEPDQLCCCNGDYSLEAHFALMVAEDRLREQGEPRSAKPSKVIIGGGEAPAEKKRGDSGYIHPDAWPSPSDIGTLNDPESTGRKRMVKMYPIEVGMVCEWARLRYAGGGPKPIIGCLNNPATDQHHGPDKNTLNNAKCSRGCGDTENIHIICSECHNAWHAANDEFYPKYDRILDQAQPWLPYTEEPWGPQNSTEEASFDELMLEEKRREERRKQRGRNTRGRNSVARTGPDLTIGDDDA